MVGREGERSGACLYRLGAGRLFLGRASNAARRERDLPRQTAGHRPDPPRPRRQAEHRAHLLRSEAGGSSRASHGLDPHHSSAQMRAAHLLDRGLNPAPVNRLILLALFLAFRGLLRGLELRPFAVGTDKAPSIVMDFLGFHGLSSFSAAKTKHYPGAAAAPCAGSNAGPGSPPN